MNGWKLTEKTYINKNTVREKYMLDPSETLDHATYLSPYYGQRSDVTSRVGNPSFALISFTDTMKNNIVSDNGVYASSTAEASISYRYAEVAHRFVFNISKFVKLPCVLTKIEYGWDGYSTASQGGVYRQTLQGWKLLRSSVPTSDESGLEHSETLTSILGAVVGGNFIFGVYSWVVCTDSPVSVTLYTDYVYVTVTYKITDLLNAPIIKPKVIGVSGYER